MTSHSFQAEKRTVKKKLAKQTRTTAFISRDSKWLGSGWLCITRFAGQRPDETHLQTLQARHCSKSSKIYSYQKLRFWFSIKNFKKLTVLLTEKKCLGFKSRTRFMVAILNNTLHNAWFQSFSSALTSWLGILCVSFNWGGWAGVCSNFFLAKKVVALPPPGMDWCMPFTNNRSKTCDLSPPWFNTKKPQVKTTSRKNYSIRVLVHLVKVPV